MAPVDYHYGGFPPGDLQWDRLIPLLGPAGAGLARYDALLSAVPNPQVLLSPLVTQEAVLSSRIEGTITTVGEVLRYDAGVRPDDGEGSRGRDFGEVLNYRSAIAEAQRLLKELPLCGRVIRAAHGVLLADVRGADTRLGEYRTSRNWIGRPGCTEEEALFRPITPDQLQDGMSRWETYLHSTQPDALVQLAIVHAEFESLHPFGDGNGRLGRMLVPLFLLKQGLLSAPTFYISEYLEARRDEYYDRLLAVSQDGDWTGWCEFFLKALTEQAKANSQKAKRILDLYEDKKDWIVEQTHSHHAIKALDFIFERMVFSSSAFAARAGIPRPTARRIVRILRERGLLVPVQEASGRRPAVLAFAELVNVAEGRDIL